MSLPKLLIIVTLVLFGAIGVAAWVKGGKPAEAQVASSKAGGPAKTKSPQVIQLEQGSAKTKQEIAKASKANGSKEAAAITQEQVKQVLSAEDLPDADRIQELFTTGSQKLPIVETISYKSQVDWQKGRAAWLSDYARHYKTSRHFIARSLNNKADYLTQEVKQGDRFNVLKLDKDLQFYLVVDTSRCLMWFYYIDPAANEKVLLKRYSVGLGRLDDKRPSGGLSPLGKYTLGTRVAVFKPGALGIYQNQKVEMIRVFGTRWVPFDQEIGDVTAGARGFGIHGAPWVPPAGADGPLEENRASVGKYESDGCIRLVTEDSEELFSIIISRPTTIELVKDFHDTTIPGNERVE